MNKIFFLAFVSLLFFACTKKEEVKFQAFSPEAFAYDIGDGWEVNATVNVKGFNKIEKGNETSISLSYSVDLINPDGKVIKDVFADNKEVNDKELNDVQLEAQFDLPGTDPLGEYKIVFNIKDNNSNKNITAQAEFELEE